MEKKEFFLIFIFILINIVDVSAFSVSGTPLENFDVNTTTGMVRYRPLNMTWLSFDGSYFNRISNTFYGTSNATFMVWVNTSDGNANSGKGVILSFADNNKGLYLRDGILFAGISNSTGIYNLSGGYINDSNWHNLAMIVNNSNLSLYIDGVIINSTIVTANSPITAFAMSWGLTDGSAIMRSDELRAYNISLSSSDILSVYNSGRIRNDSLLTSYIPNMQNWFSANEYGRSFITNLYNNKPLAKATGISWQSDNINVTTLGYEVNISIVNITNALIYWDNATIIENSLNSSDDGNFTGDYNFTFLNNQTIWIRENWHGALIPIFSNYQDDNDTIYGSGTGHFNVTVNGSDNIYLEIDNQIIPATSLGNNIYNVNHAFTKNGTYIYRWYAYGPTNIYNESSEFSYFVNTMSSSPFYLSINVTNPLTNINVQKNSFFSVIFNVTCINGTCTNFQVGLDPELVNYSEGTITSTDYFNGIPVYTKTGLPEDVNIIIEFKDEPLINYKNRIEKSNLYTFFGTTKILTNLMVLNKRNNINDRQEDFIRVIEKKFKDIEIKNSYKDLMNGIAITVKSSEVDYIKNLSNVKNVYEDIPIKIILQDSVPLINADDVWNEVNGSDSNITGEGVIVAIIDTGIAYNHTDLGNCTEAEFLAGTCARIPYGWDFVNDNSNPYDDNGHGTHVAGIIGANGNIKGVAPNVTFLNYKVCSAGGSCYPSDIISAIENATLYGANIISMSLGGSGYADSSYSTSIKNAVDNNVLVVVAAGNSGPNYNTIESPGSDPNALTVGASNKSDVIADFSSRGTGWYSNGTLAKLGPDILAPGVSINSTAPIGSCEECDESGYKLLSGTSMATPMVSGVSALIKQAHPNWTAVQIKSAITNPSTNLGYDIWTQGSGRVDALKSYNLTSVAVPSSFYVYIPITSDTYPYSLTQIINIYNLVSNQTNYTVSSELDVDDLGLVGLTLNDLSLNGSDSGNINFTLTIENQYLNLGYYNYTLTINLSNGQILRVPYMINIVGTNQSKGLISDTIGETPFYTNESNPRVLSLSENESQLVTFWVNATGDIGDTYNFYGFTDNGLDINVSDNWNVTIIGESAEFSNLADNNGTIYGSGTGVFNATIVNTNFTVGVNFNGENYTAISNNWVDYPYLYWIISPLHHNGQDFVSSVWFKTTDTSFPKSLLWQTNHFSLGLFEDNKAYFHIQNYIPSSWGENYTQYRQFIDLNATLPYPINDGNWHNLVGKWNNTEGNISIWLDGNIINSSIEGTINHTIWVLSTMIWGGNSNMSIDEVRIYCAPNDASSGWGDITENLINLWDSDIIDIYNSGRIKNLSIIPDVENMMAWVNMDEGYGIYTYNNAPKISNYQENFYYPYFYPTYDNAWGKSTQDYVTYIPIESPPAMTTYPYYWWTYGYSEPYNYTTSSTYYYTTMGNPDTIYPSFTNYQDNSGINSSETANFNITVYDTNGNVTLKIDENTYTASNLIGDIYNVSLELTPNNYSYYWTAKGSGSNHNTANSDTKWFYMTGERHYEEYIPSLNGALLVNDTRWLGQQFTIGNTNTNEDFNLTNISVYIFKTGNPSYNLTMELRNYTFGEILATSINNVTEENIPTYPSGQLRYFSFNYYPILASGNYSFVIKGDSGNDTDYLRVGYGSSGSYIGDLSRSYDSGVTWADVGNYDLSFVVHGVSSEYAPPEIGDVDSGDFGGGGDSGTDNSHWSTIYYNITNITYSNSIYFTNNGTGTGKINLFSLYKALIYFSNNSGFTYTGSISINLEPNNYTYVLNNFNLTEGITRQYSPVWLSSSTGTEKHIANNLTDSINTTVIVTISISCDNIKSIQYTPKDEAMIIITNYTCLSEVLTINNLKINPSNESNILQILWELNPNSKNICISLFGGFANFSSYIPFLFSLLAIVVVIGIVGLIIYALKNRDEGIDFKVIVGFFLIIGIIAITMIVGIIILDSLCGV